MTRARRHTVPPRPLTPEEAEAARLRIPGVQFGEGEVDRMLAAVEAP